MPDFQQVKRVLQAGGVWYIKPIVSLGTTTPPTETAVLGESDGTLRVSNYENWQLIDSILLTTSANTLLWDPSGAATDKYQVAVQFANASNAVSVAVTLGIDVGNGGTLSTAETQIPALSLPELCRTEMIPIGVMGGDDTIRGSAATPTVATVTIYARRLI